LLIGYGELGQDGSVTRPAKHDIILVEDLDLFYDEFCGYAKSWHAEQSRKDRIKQRSLVSGF